jgi:uncharacterized repeat protein (TIGR03847 family)
MPRRIHLFDPPDRFVAGTVGQPGSRTFFLQAREGRRIVSVVLEKAQVAVLADRLGRLITELDLRGITRQPDVAPAPDAAPLDEPIVEAFRAGTLTLGWDGDLERILIEARAQTEDDEDAEELEGDVEPADLDDDDEDGPDILRARMTADAARSFVERAARIVRAGRPPCPLCGLPLDAGGHICPRKNGAYIH